MWMEGFILSNPMSSLGILCQGWGHCCPQSPPLNPCAILQNSILRAQAFSPLGGHAFGQQGSTKGH